MLFMLFARGFAPRPLSMLLRQPCEHCAGLRHPQVSAVHQQRVGVLREENIGLLRAGARQRQNAALIAPRSQIRRLI